MSEKKHEDYCGYSQGACTCAVASPQATRPERMILTPDEAREADDGARPVTPDVAREALAAASTAIMCRERLKKLSFLITGNDYAFFAVNPEIEESLKVYVESAAEPAAGTTLEWTAEEIENFRKQASQPQPEPSEHLIRAMASRPSDGLTDDITMEEAMDIAQGLQDVAEGRTKPFEQIEKELSEPTTPQAERPTQNDSFWVVERFEDGKSAGYWDGANSRSFQFDIVKAIQFRRKEDAFWATRGWHWKDVQITEHMMMARAVAPVETPQRQHTKDCCLDLDHKSDCKRWMKLPPNSAYPNFKEIHVQDDWCPKAGCVPASQCDITAAHGAAQQIGAPVETPRCPFGYTKEMPGTKHDCAIHKSSDYDAQTRLTAEQFLAQKGFADCMIYSSLVAKLMEAFRDKSESFNSIADQSVREAWKSWDMSGTFIQKLSFADCRIIDERVIEFASKREAGLREELAEYESEASRKAEEIAKEQIALAVKQVAGLREEIERLIADWYKLWTEECDKVVVLRAKLAEQGKEIAGLRHRIHHLEAHNQYFFRCESAWCNPAEDSNPALLSFKQNVELREAAEAEAAALRERERWIPVEEKLPEDGTSALIFVPDWEDMYLRYRVAWINYDEASPEWIFDGHAVNGVTHWKALSAAPERAK